MQHYGRGGKVNCLIAYWLQAVVEEATLAHG